MTYNVVRLVNVDGEKHDFVFERAERAADRFAQYVTQARQDEHDYAAVVSATATSLRVTLPRTYRLTFLRAITWSVDLIQNIATEDHE